MAELSELVTELGGDIPQLAIYGGFAEVVDEFTALISELKRPEKKLWYNVA